ncbi:MAG: hypothetical protein CR967_01425, partial [Proteobacteria bacterium]
EDYEELYKDYPQNKITKETNRNKYLEEKINTFINNINFFNSYEAYFNYFKNIDEKNFTNRYIKDFIQDFNINFEETVNANCEYLLTLLFFSLSLNVEEKQKIIESIPTLSQLQYDELIKAFKEEAIKFRELEKKEPEDIKNLLLYQRENLFNLLLNLYHKRLKETND